MPAIRFRCSACQRRLGIGAHRAGAIVVCPLCQQPTQVPEPDPDPPGLRVHPEPGRAARLFEQSGFDALFRLDLPVSAPDRVSPPAESVALLPKEVMRLRDGIYLSTGQVWGICLMILLLLALSFTAGFLWAWSSETLGPHRRGEQSFMGISHVFHKALPC